MKVYMLESELNMHLDFNEEMNEVSLLRLVYSTREKARTGMVEYAEERVEEWLGFDQDGGHSYEKDSDELVLNITDVNDEDEVTDTWAETVRIIEMDVI